jgi:oligoribonuclease NrnB/cAMP/cGMP phosphodiesterase (DHH superfamily)
MNSTVLYHGPVCPDGYGAAWAAYLTLGDWAKYIPIDYGDPIPPIDTETVYILDFSFPRETMIDLGTKHKVICLDHHTTAQTSLEGLQLQSGGEIIFDMTKSGAMLAWEYFNPHSDAPTLIEYIQDRDLWTWKLPHSREVSAALDLEERTFQSWSDFALKLVDDESTIVASGTAVLKYIQGKVNYLASVAQPKVIGEHTIPAVYSLILQSEIGERICQLNPDAPFSAIYHDVPGGMKWSLRSNNGFDVSAVAKLFGGGGHKPAAGFIVKDTIIQGQE